jgi:hypothetical protein
VCFGSFVSLLTYLGMSAFRPISELQFEVANTETGVIQALEPGPRNMRYELTDFEWAAIRPFLPNKPGGVPRVNDRIVLLAAGEFLAPDGNKPLYPGNGRVPGLSAR